MNSMSVLFYLKELKIIMIKTIENIILSLDPKGPKICYNNASEPIANFSNHSLKNINYICHFDISI